MSQTEQKTASIRERTTPKSKRNFFPRPVRRLIPAAYVLAAFALSACVLEPKAMQIATASATVTATTKDSDGETETPTVITISAQAQPEEVNSGAAPTTTAGPTENSEALPPIDPVSEPQEYTRRLIEIDWKGQCKIPTGVVVNVKDDLGLTDNGTTIEGKTYYGENGEILIDVRAYDQFSADIDANLARVRQTLRPDLVVTEEQKRTMYLLILAHEAIHRCHSSDAKILPEKVRTEYQRLLQLYQDNGFGKPVRPTLPPGLFNDAFLFPYVKEVNNLDEVLTDAISRNELINRNEFFDFIGSGVGYGSSQREFLMGLGLLDQDLADAWNKTDFFELRDIIVAAIKKSRSKNGQDPEKADAIFDAWEATLFASLNLKQASSNFDTWVDAIEAGTAVR